jgi:PAS domain S-box-containing protein
MAPLLPKRPEMDMRQWSFLLAAVFVGLFLLCVTWGEPKVSAWLGGSVLGVACLAGLIYAGRRSTVLSEALGRLRSAMGGPRAAILTTDRHMRILYCNKSTKRLLGYSKGDLRGQSLDSVLPLDPDIGIQAETAPERMASARVRANHRDGGRVWMDVDIRFQRVGTKPGYIAVAKLARVDRGDEMQYRDEVRFLTDVFALTPAVVVVLDWRGSVIRMSALAEQLFGCAAPDLRQTPYWEHFLDSQEAERAKNEFAALLARPAAPRRWTDLGAVDQTWRTGRGVPLKIRWNRNVIFDDKGDVKFVVAAGQPKLAAKYNRAPQRVSPRAPAPDLPTN